ncbi:MAG: hypothetical protein ACHREM_22375 [Polyangiales bacterium]
MQPQIRKGDEQRKVTTAPARELALGAAQRQMHGSARVGASVPWSVLVRIRSLIFALILANVVVSGALTGPTRAHALETPAMSATTISGAIDLDALTARLADSAATTRTTAAEAIASTPVEALPLLEARLLRAPEGGPGAAHLVLERARKALGKSAADDAAEPLLAWTVDQPPSAGTRSLAFLLAGTIACERMKTVASARTLIHLATEPKGVVKREATATLQRLGDHAVAALIEVRRDPDKDVRALASKQLDALGKYLPSDAVQVKEPQQLADVLIAFGRLGDADATRAILPYLNADRALVRDAARWSIAKLGEQARGPLGETYESFTSDKAPDDWRADRVLRELLAAYDKVRLADVFRLFDQGVAARDAGKLDEAAKAFDALLARAPTFERRAELAPTYFELGKKALSLKPASDRATARTMLVKASRLAQGTPLASSIDARLLYVTALDSWDHGVVDTASLQQAVALDPALTEARELLSRASKDADDRAAKVRRFAAAAAAGVLAALAAILFLGRRDERPRTRPRGPMLRT